MASVLYYLAKKVGKTDNFEFSSDSEKIHGLIYSLKEIQPDVYEKFVFCNRYPYKYSYEVNDALASLTSSEIITAMANPSFNPFRIKNDESGIKYIEEIILPRLSKEENKAIEQSLDELRGELIKTFLE